MFAVACELYGDGIDLKEFEEFWGFYESKKGHGWRKVVGDNIIQAGKPTYAGNPASAKNLESAANVSIQKKSYNDWGSISKLRSALWRNQDVSIEEHISTVDDIIENKIPVPQISKSEFKEFKYFVVYEYTTDKGRSFYLLAMTRSLNGPPK